MKKIVKCLVLIVFAVLLNCCATNKIIYDKSIPAEQLCSLEIPYSLAVTNFDGENVKWERGLLGKTALVKMPAGEHELTANYLSQSQKGNMVYISSAKDLKVKYNFKPGMNYKLQEAVFLNRITVGIDEIYK
jgi:hypothetical protein